MYRTISIVLRLNAKERKSLKEESRCLSLTQVHDCIGLDPNISWVAVFFQPMQSDFQTLVLSLSLVAMAL